MKIQNFRWQDGWPSRAVAVATIERTFGRPVEAIFSSFEETPLAAATPAKVSPRRRR